MRAERVLVVDDEERIRSLVGTYLQAEGFEVDEAATGEEALVEFRRRQLIEQVWGWDFFGDERVVAVHVRNLRRALGDSAESPRFVGTVRSVGYRLVPAAR